ncbi:MAG: DUF3298 domain-containing protein [Oscillospiraceae bacterium]|nr:DUF3298 domain-containing protein [Oscillospiraceae bacterium]
MKKIPFPPHISLQTHNRQWTQEGIPLLLSEASLPCLSSAAHKKSARRINLFYRRYLRAFYRFCEKDLLPRAKADFFASLAQSRPIPVTDAALRSSVTYAENALLSLYTDLTVTAADRSFFTRSADTWDLKTGCPISLGECFPDGRVPKKTMVAFARQKAAEGIAAGENYREDYRRALRRCFSSRRFYLTEEGLVFYYQPGSVAPMTRGPVAFLMPYHENGPRLPT